MRYSDTGDIGPITCGTGVPPGGTQARRLCHSLDAWEAQQIFREMVTAELLNGRLSARRRKRIVQYAAHLDIHPRLAGRIVAQARRIAAQRCPGATSVGETDTPPATLTNITHRMAGRPKTWFWVAVVALLAAGICVISSHAILP